MASSYQDVSVLICDPYCLYATSIGILGKLHVLVYRSIQMEDWDDDYEPVMRFVRGAQPLIRSVVENCEMLFGAAEMIVYHVDKPAEAA